MSVLSLFCFSHSLAKALKKGDIHSITYEKTSHLSLDSVLFCPTKNNALILHCISFLCMQAQGASYAMHVWCITSTVTTTIQINHDNDWFSHSSCFICHTNKKLLYALLHFFNMFFSWRFCYNIWKQFFDQLITIQKPARKK